MTKRGIAAGLFLGGIGLLLTPALFGAPYPSAAAISGTVIGSVMALAAVGLAYGSLQLWSGIALGIGAWAFVAPVAFGFLGGNAGFWTHLAAGFVSMVAGIAGHELLARTREPNRGADKPTAG